MGRQTERETEKWRDGETESQRDGEIAQKA